MNVFRKAYGAYRYAARRLNPTGYGGNRGYVGQFGGFHRPKMKDSFALSGVKNEDEKYGQVQSPKVCYLGFRSFKTDTSAGSLLVAIAGAMLRKIYYDEFKWDIDDWYKPLRAWDTYPTGYADTAPAYQINFYYSDADPTQTPTVAPTMSRIIVEMVETWTFWDLVQYVVNNVFRGATNGQGYLLRFQLHGYSINRIDSIDGTTGGQSYESPIRPFKNWYVDCYSAATLAVQNASSADGAAGDPLSTERVDSNPLQGRVFKFNKNYPVINHKFTNSNIDALQVWSAPTILHNTWKLADENGDGIVYLNQTSTNAINGPLAQIPQAYDFDNVSGVGNVMMAPGEIKKIVLRYRYNGRLSDAIAETQLQATYANTYEEFQRPRKKEYADGTSCLLAVEPVMSNGAALTTLNFEVTYNCGAKINKGGRECMSKLTGGNNATAATADPQG